MPQNLQVRLVCRFTSFADRDIRRSRVTFCTLCVLTNVRDLKHVKFSSCPNVLFSRPVLRNERHELLFRQNPLNVQSYRNYQNRYDRTSFIQCHFSVHPKNQNNRRFDQSRLIY